MDLYEEIKTRYGVIKRCRGYYLYSEKARLLDMYLDSGMSVLGRRQNRSDLALKQSTDCGLSAFLPSAADRNLKKALRILFPYHTEVRFYSHFTGENALLNIKTEKDFQANLWRPFLPACRIQTEKAFFFVQPPRCTSIKIAVFKPEAIQNAPPSCPVTAAEKAALAKAFFALIKELRCKKTVLYEACDVDKDCLPENTVKNACNTYKNTTYSAYPPYLSQPKTYYGKNGKKIADFDRKGCAEAAALCRSIWTINGCYLFPKITQAQYQSFFKAALDAKILVSPDFNIPSILPKIKTYTELINFLKGFLHE